MLFGHTLCSSSRGHSHRHGTSLREEKPGEEGDEMQVVVDTRMLKEMTGKRRRIEIRQKKEKKACKSKTIN